MRLIMMLAVLVWAGAARAETAILAGGCFWCVEANFETVPGVSDVTSGYTGGTLANPTYKDVTSETSGHYEAVRITYDPARVTYAEILRLFLRSTDVVDADGQFCDRGPSYRSAIFVADAAQRKVAETALTEAAAKLGQPVATQILPAARFWPAEAYHQDYAKGTGIVLTRRGPKSQAKAYAFYRKSCGRDQRVKALWGTEAAFVH